MEQPLPHVIRAPDSITGVYEQDNQPHVFLSGPLGPWRDKVIAETKANVVFLDPVRPDWDFSWKSDTSDARFVKQSEWEINAILRHTAIFLCYLPAGAQAPISMVELGMASGSAVPHVVVACEDGFFKKGYVNVLVQNRNGRVFDTLDEAVAFIRQHGTDV